MASRLTAKLAATGAAGALAAAALVAATGAANADTATISNTTPLDYSCTLLTGGTVNLAATFTVPSTIAEGAGAASSPVSISSVIDPTSVANLDSALKTLGMSSFNGTVTGGFGYTGGGSGSLNTSFTIPTTQAPPAGSPYTMNLTGTMAAPTTGSGTASIYAPAALSLNVNVGGTPFAIGCALSPSSQNTQIGDVTVTPAVAGTGTATLAAKASGEKVTATATSDGSTAGTGTVKLAFTGKVHKTAKVKGKKVTKTVAKKFSAQATLNSAGKATFNLAKDKLVKGSYKVTLSWNGTKATTTVKVK